MVLPRNQKRRIYIRLLCYRRHEATGGRFHPHLSALITYRVLSVGEADRRQ